MGILAKIYAESLAVETPQTLCKDRYTLRNPVFNFPHVENLVENVKKRPVRGTFSTVVWVFNPVFHSVVESFSVNKGL